MIDARIAAVFPEFTRDRGERYQRDGRVRIMHSSPELLEAVVRGTHPYRVQITVDPRGRATVQCDCPYAVENGGVCKHGWATLLEAAARYTLPAALSSVGGFDHEPAARKDVRQTPQREWQRRLGQLRQRLDALPPAAAPAAWPDDRRLVYIVDVPATLGANELLVELGTERRLKDGSWDRPRQFALGAERWLQVPDEVDRRIAQMLVGARTEHDYHGTAPSRRFVLREHAYETTFRLMCETGRCRLRREPGEEHPEPLAWDDGAPWELRLEVTRATRGPAFRVDGVLHRDDRTMPLSEPALLLHGGLLIADGLVARFEHHGAFALAADLRERGELAVGSRELPALLESLHTLPTLPPVQLPDELGIAQVRATPVPHLTVSAAAPSSPWGGAGGLSLALAFSYDGTVIPATRAERVVFDRAGNRVLHRDLAFEERAGERLRDVGARDEHEYHTRRRSLVLPPHRLDAAVRTLILEGWRVEAEGRVYRQAGASHARLRSGVDWFELEAGVAFGDQQASLPQLLDALRRGDRTVRLDDGSLGLLPEEWLRRYAPLAGAGTEGDDGALRFSRSQVALLDAMLAAMPEVDTDVRFAQARAELRSFDHIAPVNAPRGFTGELRPYQREGLGWLHFLRRFGFGGCLADDMGLGKTVQVLALLEARRAGKCGPSLVVVPKSLVFNWRQEAERFAPKLRIVDHTGTQRRPEALAEGGYDLLITTYGTLRRDVAELREIEFDYVILDEAQAIKNAGTASAKAARLLRGQHRLALSGTPVENRLEELWSLFEFLNPGMLGSSALFAAAGAGATAADEDARRLLSRALRPFLLRRTKDQVARDLPEKQEQTLHVDLGPKQRKLYDELRDHYRAALLGHIDRVGIKRSKIQILEALLRLRQAACHPGLIDPSRADEPGGKLDALLPMVQEAVAEGHKVLVFSQFTSLLALVRQRLDAEHVTYEYLDGRTRDRQARVERFQTDPACPVFLISLKAGGQGLNLTAADYVFLLDPWWNPAVEAQAIDRAHRIGQARPVLATRLIARDTVEERVLDLQRSKRDLAEAIITADNSLIARIERDELELLLG